MASMISMKFVYVNAMTIIIVNTAEFVHIHVKLSRSVLHGNHCTSVQNNVTTYVIAASDIVRAIPFIYRSSML